MVATTKQPIRTNKLSALPLMAWGLSATEFLAVYVLAWRGNWWILAVLVIAAIELRGLLPSGRTAGAKLATVVWQSLPGLVMGVSVTLIVAMLPRHASQVGAALLYGAWLVWRLRQTAEAGKRLVHLLLVQAVMFEAIFLMAAVWHMQDGSAIPAWIILMLVWVGAYFTVYGAFTLRGDPSAGVMAATWGVIATEVAWVLMLWLITYTMSGGYVLVPQPALILTSLAYIFGSILASSRQGNLSRVRLGEYMVIAMILVGIVVVGTSWRGNI